MTLTYRDRRRARQGRSRLRGGNSRVLVTLLAAVRGSASCDDRTSCIGAHAVTGSAQNRINESDRIGCDRTFSGDVAATFVANLIRTSTNNTGIITARAVSSSSGYIALCAAAGRAAAQRVGFVFYRMCAVYRARAGFASRGSLNPGRL
jgi:hypothetical protein